MICDGMFVIQMLQINFDNMLTWCNAEFGFLFGTIWTSSWGERNMELILRVIFVEMVILNW